MKKPTGKIGPFKAKVTESGKVAGGFDQVEYPDGKDDIEEIVVKNFLKSAKKTFKEFFFISNPDKNNLDDFDFTVQTPKGDAHLELMEIAPLELYRSGFETAPSSYDTYELVSFIFSKIKGKSEKYPPNMSNELFLLLYITDFEFVFSEAAINLLRYFCMKEPLKFNVIFLYTPLDAQEGTVNWIHPMDENDFIGFDPEKCRGKVINLDPEKFEIKSGNQP